MSARLSTVQGHFPEMCGLVMAFGLLYCAGAWAAEPAAGTVGTVDRSRSQELIALVRQDCGSCHGLTLKGGLGPALLPEVLKDKPADFLKFVILQGRPGTAMPPWQKFLSDADATWIVSNLQKGFPP